MENFITKDDIGIAQKGLWSRFVVSIAMKALKFERINELVSGIDTEDNIDFANTVLVNLDLAVECSEESLSNIPKRGGFLAVANFPHGIADCIALMSLIGKSRKKVKFLVEPQLAELGFFKKIAIQASGGSKYNLIKHCVDHLKRGGVLVVFPAVVVGGYTRFLMHPKESAWKSELLKIAKIAKVDMIPFFIDGCASVSFLTIGRLFPYVKPLMYARELIKSEGGVMEIAIGHRVNYDEIVKGAKAENLSVKVQSQVVSDTLRGVLFLQSVKLSDGFVPQPALEHSKVKVEHVVVDEGGTVLNVGSLSLYIIENQVVVKSGKFFLMTAKFKKHQFDSSGSVGEMESLDDFEFNYRKLIKNVNSCVEIYDLSINSDKMSAVIDDFEKLIKQFIKYTQVDVLMTSITAQRRFNNIVSAAFIHYLDAVHVAGPIGHSVMSKGLLRHDEYVGPMLRSETLNFYCAPLFATYGEQLDSVDVPGELLVFLKTGAEVVAISRKIDKDDRFFRSFLVCLS